jgi:hypothetical protein
MEIAMTDRRQALIRVRDAVRASDLSTISAEHIYAAFGKHYQKRFWEIYQSGSLNAAKALQEAVLPEWWCKLRLSTRPTASMGRLDPEVEGHDDNPARAWLLAILEALIASEGDCND